MCRCLERLYNKELTKELGTLMRRGDESFENFDLSIYPAQADPAAGVVQALITWLIKSRSRD